MSILQLNFELRIYTDANEAESDPENTDPAGEQQAEAEAEANRRKVYQLLEDLRNGLGARYRAHISEV